MPVGPHNSPNWSWHGLGGVLLAGAGGLGWAAAMIITAVKDGPVTEVGGQILYGLGGALFGSVATWLGLAGGRKPGDPDSTEPPEKEDQR